jgi:hypothetical protein
VETADVDAQPRQEDGQRVQAGNDLTAGESQNRSPDEQDQHVDDHVDQLKPPELGPIRAPGEVRVTADDIRVPVHSRS